MNSILAASWSAEEGFRPVSGIDPADRGFRYGMSIFTTVAMRAGQPLLLDDHWAQLRRDWPFAADLNLPAIAQVRAWAAQLPWCEGVIRFYITAGPGGPLDAVVTPRVFALAEALTLPPVGASYRLGLGVAPMAGSLPLKSGCYWPRIHKLQEAKSSGWDEVLLVQEDGRIVSAAMANLFFRRDGVWLTPPTTDGARAGVVRQWVINRALAKEQSIHRTELPEIEAGFLTNSRLGICRIAQVEAHVFLACPAVVELEHLYRKEVLGE